MTAQRIEKAGKYPRTQEWRDAHRARMLAYWADPERRIKMLAQQAAGYDAEYRARRDWLTEEQTAQVVQMIREGVRPKVIAAEWLIKKNRVSQLAVQYGIPQRKSRPRTVAVAA